MAEGHANGQPEHRLRLVTLPSIDRKALIYEQGNPDEAHRIVVYLLDGILQAVYGFRPRSDIVRGTDLRVNEDGTLVVVNDSANLAGYVLTQKYKVESALNPGGRYVAALLDEQMRLETPPTEPWAVLTAAFIAKWYGLGEDLGRFVPSAQVRQAIPVSPETKPRYIIPRAQLGKVTLVPSHGQSEAPKVTSEALQADGQTEFLLGIPQYESIDYFMGSVAFTRDAGGRWTVRSLVVTKQWSLTD